MTSSVRTKSSRRGGRGAGQLIIGILIVLGVIASLFLVFSESVELLRVGLVAALWAAIAGAIAMTKYRRESALDKAKVRDLQTVYELQLEREISARREFEMGVETRVRHEVRADSEELAGLRQELAALRANLQVLFEGQLPVDRVALRADSMRVQELARGSYGSYQPAPSGLFVPENRPPAPAYDSETDVSPHFASPYDEPVTAETSILMPDMVPETPAATDEQQPEPATSPEPVVEPALDVVEPALDVESEPAHEPLPEPAAGSRRRRRAASSDADDAAGSHSSGLTVAEIMANLQSEGSGNEGVPRPSRHRS